MKLTCSKCYGNKTYRGMGCVMVKCEPCKGTGSIEIESKLSDPESTPEPLKKVSKDKRNAKEKGQPSEGKKA